MLQNIKGAIFDLDGVIVDTAKYHYLAWKETANHLGITFTEVDNERLKGVSRQRSLEIIMEIGGITLESDQQQKLLEEKNDLYLSYISKLDASEILPGVTAFMEKLKSKNIKIALGSASKNANLILEKLGIKHWFDVIIDGNLTSKAKPDPEVFLLGSSAMQFDSNDCIVFEDAEAGVAAAKAADMSVVGIGSLEQLGKADLVVQDFIALYPLVFDKEGNFIELGYK